MDHDPRCCARVDPPDTDLTETPMTDIPMADTDPADLSVELPTELSVEDAERIDWVEAQTELDRCDGYVVLAVDPQTGEVDAHGPFPGLDATEIADEMREDLDREGLDDVVIRVVRWHQDRTDDSAA
ncbi:hypothetical protein [Actinomycetospora aeridis]|uniref:Uncharacterized protein n=1 Tax=Actinomycetospora aeridis TaxID=3129231 RepID=A0ABU8N8P9_9PSEU